MLKRLISTVCIVSMAATLVAPAAMAQNMDVPPDHWAADAVRELADKGLVLGYPDGKFLGNRALTRYEMATIIQRVLKNLEGMKTTDSTTRAIEGMSDDDKAALKKLIDEYKVELTVIGTDLKKVQEELAGVKADVDTLKEDVETVKGAIGDPEGTVQATAANVSKMLKLKLSGYVQARFVDGQRDYRTDAGSSLGVGRSAFGGNNDVSNIADFTIRRARLKMEGSFGKNTKVIWQIDGGGSNRERSVETRDAYLEYYINGIPDLYPTITLGQFKWPFGYEVVLSSGDRETPERADFLRYMFPGERDRGIQISGPMGQNLKYYIGLFNGVGIEQAGNTNTTAATSSQPNPWYSTGMADNNSHKDVVARLALKVSDSLDVGASGYWGKAGTSGTQLKDKIRYGADFQWYGSSIPLSIKAEYAWAKDPSYLRQASGQLWQQHQLEMYGYYIQAGWAFNSGLQAIYKYDYFDTGISSTYPGSVGRRKNHQLGLIRWLDDQSRLKVFYTWRDEARNSYDNDGLTVEWITKF